jgi:hypothetical protein
LFNGPLGVLGGVLYSGVDTFLRGRVPWTLRRHKKGEMCLCFFSFDSTIAVFVVIPMNIWIFSLLPPPAPTPAGL